MAQATAAKKRLCFLLLFCLFHTSPHLASPLLGRRSARFRYCTSSVYPAGLELRFWLSIPCIRTNSAPPALALRLRCTLPTTYTVHSLGHELITTNTLARLCHPIVEFPLFTPTFHAVLRPKIIAIQHLPPACTCYTSSIILTCVGDIHTLSTSF